MYTALVLKVTSKIVHITGGDLMTVDIVKMRVLFASLVSMSQNDNRMMLFIDNNCVLAFVSEFKQNKLRALRF